MLPPIPMQTKHLTQKILSWFDEYGRKDLPWQQEINPYRVWVSEIMLQQTQVATVIPYYKKFIAHFPDIESLATASLDEVLQYWAGLGYYARARNLHKTANIIQQQYSGQFPESIDQVIELPGIGRSTAGAILSIACQQAHPILDGNVKRVFSRYHGISGWTGDSRISRELWKISERYTPSTRTADYTQAIMDLGATLCTRSKPNCSCCPLTEHCFARIENKTAELPTPKPKKTPPVKQSFFLLLRDKQQKILLQQRPPAGIWGGLWSLPEFEDVNSLHYWCENNYPDFTIEKKLEPRRHTFSHFHLDYTPIIVSANNPENFVMEGNHSVWYKNRQIGALALPAPVKRLLQEHTEE